MPGMGHERSVHLTDLGWVVFEERRGELVPLPGGPYADEEAARRALDATEGAATDPPG